MESYTKPTNYHNFNNFLKNHQSFPYKKGKSLKDMLVRAKKKVNKGFHARIDVRPVTFCFFSHNRFVSILAVIPAVFYITSVVNCLVSS